MNAVFVKLGASPNDSEFHDATWLEVTVACAKVFEDIPTRIQPRFSAACADYCDEKKRALKETSDRFFQEMLHGTPAPVREPPDKRSHRERMESALERLIECSK